MVLDKCLLVWLFLLDRLSAIWFCLIIKIKAQYLSICLIQSGLMTVCLSLHNVLAVILRCVLLFYVLSEIMSLNLMGYFINRIRETLQVRFQISSSVFHCAIEFISGAFLSLIFCDLFSCCLLLQCQWLSVVFFYQVLLLPPSCVYQMTWTVLTSTVSLLETQHALAPHTEWLRWDVNRFKSQIKSIQFI